MRVQRYTWEDALIEGESLGLLPAGAVNCCLRLARAINWEPKNGGPSSLRWKNVDALQSVNSSRATYFRYRQVLFETGFLTEKNGNLVPLVPDLSQIETSEYQVETSEAHIETGESQIEHPYSEDLYSEDLLSETLYSEDKEAPVGAETPTLTSPNPLINEAYDFESFNIESLTFAVGTTYVLTSSGITRQSHIETEPDRWAEYEARTAADWLAIRRSRPLSGDEHEYVNASSRAYLEAERAKQPAKVACDW